MTKWITQTLDTKMTQSANPLSEQHSWMENTRVPVTPQTNPVLWYQWYGILQEDAPEILDTFLENTAAKMDVTVDYLMDEFL